MFFCHIISGVGTEENVVHVTKKEKSYLQNRARNSAPSVMYVIKA